jgi:hypothetical protein
MTEEPPYATQLPVLPPETPPIKPVYGVMDFQAQLVIPMSQNPPITPIDGSVYIDTDDLRLYAWVNGAWRASRISALPGVGIKFEQDALGVTTISATFVPEAGTGIRFRPDFPTPGITTIETVPLPPTVFDLTLQSPWIPAVGAPTPQGLKDATGFVQLRGGCDPGGLQPINAGPITILPSGWRPAQELLLNCVGGTAWQCARIDPDGKITIVNGNGKPTRLAGLSYIADGN